LCFTNQHSDAFRRSDFAPDGAHQIWCLDLAEIKIHESPNFLQSFNRSFPEADSELQESGMTQDQLHNPDGDEFPGLEILR
jgi:hypothetical protein